MSKAAFSTTMLPRAYGRWFSPQSGGISAGRATCKNSSTALLFNPSGWWQNKADPALHEVKLPPRSPAALRLQTPDGRTLHPCRRRAAKRPNKNSSPPTDALDGEERRCRQRRRRGIVGNAVKSNGEYVTVRVRRSIDVEVPRGYPVSEKTWTEFKAGCSVTFNKRIRAVLLPSKEEIYPTAALWASCFYSSNDYKMHRFDISGKGGGKAEWAALLEETRQVAAEGRKESEDEQEKEGEHQHQHQHQHQPNESAKAARGAGDCLDQSETKKLEQSEAEGGEEEGGAASHGVSDCAGQNEKRSPVEAEASPQQPVDAPQEKEGGGGGGGDAKGGRKLTGIIINSLKKWFRELMPHGVHGGGGVNVHIDWVEAPLAGGKCML
ncbi:unnamed protein product [Ectocarpus sp. 12 AP-2014]